MSSLQVVATAGHVDHGKSSLIVRLTGIDPDRWEEEKRRGLTIDLGFAWCTLPSGAEIGFVDVPGHERFIRNMLAGIGPVRLVLFVVAADEGWKPQSEEHLEIADVLAADASVIGLTKADLAHEETLAAREGEIRERTEGTALAGAPIVRCSARTGDGIEELRRELDRMVAAAPPPADRGRPRIHVDRSFTIRGAGTVVTGTLSGGALRMGDEVVILPAGTTTRIRSMQTHRRRVEVAAPISRLAANLAGVAREDAARGDVVVRRGQWRPTTQLDVELRPVRSFDEALTARGAYKLYLGAAERDARLRIHEAAAIEPRGSGFARLRLTQPVVAAFGDRLVLREAGRRRTVAGGRILDPHPVGRGDASPALARRASTHAEDLPELLVEERGVVPVRDVLPLTGTEPTVIPGAKLVTTWWIAERVLGTVTRTATERVARHHAERPLDPGIDAVEVRSAIQTVVAGEPVADAILDHLVRAETLVREGTTLRLPGHAVMLGERGPDADRLVEGIVGAEPTPPTIPELLAGGVDRDLIDACVRTGRLVAVSRDVVVTPALLARAEAVAREEAAAPDGLTVSRFRERLGTTRKYALPLLAWFDDRRITRRDGDVRRLRRGG